jgi:hypothetical protein
VSYGVLALPANVRHAWKKPARDKRSSLFFRRVAGEEKKRFLTFPADRRRLLADGLGTRKRGHRDVDEVKKS